LLDSLLQEMHLMKKCVLINHRINSRLLQPKRLNHNEIWECNPDGAAAEPTILLFGYAGSPKKNLLKYQKLYSDLGYRSISTILPHHYIFHYDIAKIRDTASRVVEQITKTGNEKVVVHAFSNNGAIAYQHMYCILQEYNKLHMIKGLIMDSGPGPLGIRDNILKRDYIDNTNPAFLAYGLLSVNSANGVALLDNLRNVRDQLRVLPKKFKENKNIPGPGTFLTHHEKGSWPLLMLYSKEDQFIPHTYIERILQHQRKRNSERRIESNLFAGSGHVAHFSKFPEQYKQIVNAFIQSL